MKAPNSIGFFLDAVQKAEPSRPGSSYPLKISKTPVRVLGDIAKKAGRSGKAEVPVFDVMRTVDLEYGELFSALQNLESQGLVCLEGKGEDGVVKLTPTANMLLQAAKE